MAYLYRDENITQGLTLDSLLGLNWVGILYYLKLKYHH